MNCKSGVTVAAAAALAMVGEERRKDDVVVAVMVARNGVWRRMDLRECKLSEDGGADGDWVFE